MLVNYYNGPIAMAMTSAYLCCGSKNKLRNVRRVNGLTFSASSKFTLLVKLNKRIKKAMLNKKLIINCIHIMVTAAGTLSVFSKPISTNKSIPSRIEPPTAIPSWNNISKYPLC